MTLLHGDCLEVMRTLDENSIDTIITDPPYGLEFMGKDWDNGVPGIRFWEQALRIAKPGAIMLAFGGTRTYHRLVCAIEDAGWEIRDMIEYVYGSGFPKSHNISKAMDKEQSTPEAQLWDGWGTALKPAHEPIVVAMKPLDGTFVNNALTWGVAGLNIDGARVEHNEPEIFTDRTADKFGRTHAGGNGWRGKPEEQKLASPNSSGRFPANLIHDGSDEVTGLFPQTKTGGSYCKTDCGDSMFGKRKVDTVMNTDNINGSAARFFYCAKSSRRERNAGLPEGETCSHPTVKPIELMRYLVRLTKTPTGGVVLDPFMGSGTTGCACELEGREFIGIEMNEEYIEIAEKRIAHWKLPLFQEVE